MKITLKWNQQEIPCGVVNTVGLLNAVGTTETDLVLVFKNNQSGLELRKLIATKFLHPNENNTEHSNVLLLAYPGMIEGDHQFLSRIFRYLCQEQHLYSQSIQDLLSVFRGKKLTRSGIFFENILCMFDASWFRSHAAEPYSPHYQTVQGRTHAERTTSSNAAASIPPSSASGDSKRDPTSVLRKRR